MRAVSGPRTWSRAGSIGGLSGGCGAVLSCTRAPHPRQRLERDEDAINAPGLVDRREVAPMDDAGRVDDEQRAFGDAFIGAVDTVAPGDVAFGFEVGQQRELELALLGVGGVAPGAVDGEANKLRVKPAELGED